MSRSAVAVVAIGIVAGCSHETVVVAGLGDPDASDAAPSDASILPSRCVDNDDCPVNAFCAKATCDARVGTCETRALVCGANVQPTCGCDGVTYWNDCLRRGAGINERAAGECALDQAASCDGAMACPEDTFCARLLPDARACGGPPDRQRATCWALPATCPNASPGEDRWVECAAAPPAPPPSGACLDTCSAIRTERPHRRATSCP